jgi:hypothetical protein
LLILFLFASNSIPPVNPFSRGVAGDRMKRPCHPCILTNSSHHDNLAQVQGPSAKGAQGLEYASRHAAGAAEAFRRIHAPGSVSDNSASHGPASVRLVDQPTNGPFNVAGNAAQSFWRLGIESLEEAQALFHSSEKEPREPSANGFSITRS